MRGVVRNVERQVEQLLDRYRSSDEQRRPVLGLPGEAFLPEECDGADWADGWRVEEVEEVCEV